MLKKLIVLTVLVFVASMVFVALPAAAADGVGFAWIRVAHASPDAPNVDVWVNGSVAISDLAFGEITDYLMVPTGTYNVQVTPTGLAAPVVIDADLPLQKNVAYTVAATDVLANITPMVYIDDNSMPGPGLARVNFGHLSPDAPNVDVWVDGAVAITDLAFQEVSPYLEVPAGTYNVKVTPTGVAAPVVIDIDVSLDAGTVYSAYVEGLLAGPPPLQPVLAAFAPKGTVWFLAEGSTLDGMETWVLVMNPNDVPATVGLTFMTENGPVAGPSAVLPPMTRQTWMANQFVSSYDVSTEVTSDQPVVAERAMYGNGRTWAHNSIGVTYTAEEWLLAEGATAQGFETFILVQNPNPDPVTLDITFMTLTAQIDGPQDHVLDGHSRVTFYANKYVTDTNVSTMVVADGGEVIAERAVYGLSRPWTWGTNSIGYAP